MAMVCRQLYYTSNSRYHGIELCTRRIYTVGDVLLKVLEIDDGWGLVMFRCSYESQEKVPPTSPLPNESSLLHCKVHHTLPACSELTLML